MLSFCLPCDLCCPGGFLPCSLCIWGPGCRPGCAELSHPVTFLASAPLFLPATVALLRRKGVGASFPFTPPALGHQVNACPGSLCLTLGVFCAGCSGMATLPPELERETHRRWHGGSSQTQTFRPTPGLFGCQTALELVEPHSRVSQPSVCPLEHLISHDSARGFVSLTKAVMDSVLLPPWQG